MNDLNKSISFEAISTVLLEKSFEHCSAHVYMYTCIREPINGHFSELLNLIITSLLI